MTYEIRRATAKDAPVIKALRLEMLSQDGPAFDIDASQAHQQPLQHWELWASHPRAVFLAQYHHSFVAMIAGTLQDEVAHIGALWVHPSHRSHGLASQLLTAANSWAQVSARRCELSVAEWNTSAIALYERLGYSLTGQATSNRWGHLELVMERPVLL